MEGKAAKGEFFFVCFFTVAANISLFICEY